MAAPLISYVEAFWTIAPMFTRIGKYQIEREIGRGGFGQVYRGFDPSVGRAVAIKVLNPGGDASLLERFRNEAVTAGNLQHKHIVTVYEFGEHEGLPYLVMEFLEGNDLQHVMRGGGPASLLEKVRIMSQVASGLHSAHAHGVAHLDVKPANIILLPDGNVKIMDFGIARLLKSQSGPRPAAGSLEGSLLYMSPEQFGSGPIDALCDIWAFGVIYYELISGHHPFPASEPAAAMYQIQRMEPPLLHEVVPACPPALGDIVSRALAKDRELRYQSLEDLRLDAEPILQTLQKGEAAKLAEQAQAAAKRSDVEMVQTLVKRILELDSTNQVARNLRESMRQGAQRKLVRSRAEILIKQGNEQLSTGQYQGAIESFEAALRLDESDSAARSRLAEARSKLARSEKAGELVRSAKIDLESHNLSQALERASEAVRIDPENPEAIETLSAVKAATQSHGSGAVFRREIERANQLAHQALFDDAMQVLNELRCQYPAAPEIEDAVAAIARLKNDALERVHTDARKLIEGRDFDGARTTLEIALKTHPQEPTLTSLLQTATSGKAAQERESAILGILLEAEVLARNKRAPEALELVTKAAPSYPGDPRLPAIRDRLTAYLRKTERAAAIASAAAEIEELLKSAQLDRALPLAEAALARFPDSQDLSRMCETVRAAKLQRDQERDAALAIDRARRLEQDSERAAAWNVIMAALCVSPDSEPLRAYMTRLRSRMSEAQRTSAAARERADIEELLMGRRYAEALARAELGCRADEDDFLMEDLHKRVQSMIREAGDRYTGRIRTALDSGAFEQAEELLQEGLRVLPKGHPLGGFEADLVRQRDYRQCMDAANRQLQAGDLDKAERSAQQALNVKAGDRAAEDLLQGIEQRRAAQDRRRRIDHARKNVRELIAKERFEDARNFLRAAIKNFPDAPEFHADLATVDAAQRERETQRRQKSTGV